MVLVQDLIFAYPGHATPIFAGPTWRLERGERWAVIGPSGCGKSTLLHLIVGVLLPGAGRVTVNNEAVPRKRNRGKTGLVLQDYGLLPWATLRENVSLGLRARAFYGQAVKADGADRVDAWLRRLGIDAVAHHYPARVSGGQRQRAAIARALALEPDVLLMDEPFAALDDPTREDLERLTLALHAETETTLVFVTHNLEEAVLMGRKILVLGPPPTRASSRIHPRPWAPPRTAPRRNSRRSAAPCARGWAAMRRRDVFLTAGALAICWEVAALLLRRDFFPLPTEVLAALVTQLPRGLARHLAVSTWRVVASIGIAVALATPAGLVLGQSPRINRLVSPLVYLLYPVPKIVFLPIVLLFLGIGETSKVFIIFLILFFQILVVVRDAAGALRPELLLSVTSLGAGRRALYRLVYLPATVPAVLTAVRLSIGTAVAVLFFAESFATRTGLGYYVIVDTFSRLAYPEMYAGVVAMSLLGIGLYAVVDVLERALCPFLFVR